MNISFSEAKTKPQLQQMAKLAADIWGEYWPAIIGEAQTQYMIENFQDYNSICTDISQRDHHYWFILAENGEVIGYTAGNVDKCSNRYYLSKAYLLKKWRGQKLSEQILAHYIQLCQEEKLDKIFLNVNKENHLAISAYKRLGFKVIESTEKELGGGFIMDDFVMQLDLV